jgi:phage terminase Nu1 subunit (DNA packaging protein)
MHGHPTLGVKNAKPRLSSRPGPKIGKLSEEYLRIRNRQMNTKALTAEMILAQRRGELIEKSLVTKQAAFLLLSLRQRILAVPDRLARQLVNIADVNNVRTILKQAMLALLTELADLPSKVTNPRWLDEVAAEETEAEGGK